MDRYYQCPGDLSDDLGGFPEWGVFGTQRMRHILTDESLEVWCDEYPDDLDADTRSVAEFNEKWAPWVYVPDRRVSICRDGDARLRKE